MKTLLIIDPQNDFVTGTLPVPGAVEQLEQLAKTLPHIPVHDIVLTMDCHPLGHSSFAPNGGPWPVHCVKYSEGAAILPCLFDALSTIGDPSRIHFIEKGKEINKDEYSAFEVHCPEVLKEAEEIYVCGVAGDVCVHTSISDLIRLGLKDKLTIITDASPSLDGGNKLNELIRHEALRACTLSSFM